MGPRSAEAPCVLPRGLREASESRTAYPVATSNEVRYQNEDRVVRLVSRSDSRSLNVDNRDCIARFIPAPNGLG